MSRTYDLACLDCKKALWIAQESRTEGRPRVYTYKNAVHRLEDFLGAHTGHRLLFDLDSKPAIEACEEISDE